MLIKYIKSVLWRVAKFLSYIDEARCLKVKVGKSGNETTEMLRQDYGGETLSGAAVFQWWRRFKDGDTRVIDKARSGRPSTAVTDVNIAKTAELLENDRRLTLRELSASLNISFERTQRIVTDTANASCVCQVGIQESHRRADATTSSGVHEHCSNV